MVDSRKLQNKDYIVLVVDDDYINRTILCKILERDYKIIQADSGQEALSILRKRGDEVSLVLLEIDLDDMNGYMVLDVIKDDPVLSTIPVIAMTSSDREEEEIHCLESGASDFLTQPYSPEVVKHRVTSMIRLRESVKMLNSLEYDHLTGLYSKEFFYRYARSVIDQYPDKKFDIVCSDVENFKLVNERYGVEKGDEYLCYLANKYRRKLKEHEICGRIGGDVFAFLVEHRDGYVEHQFADDVKNGFQDAPVRNVAVKFGQYEIVNPNLPVSGMCDRAMLALGRIKNQYGQYVALYDDSLRLTLLKEQRIQDSMEAALERREFKIYYQPKHNIRCGGVSGAEALVRWQHPEFGLMSPGQFIPLFEKNGFITRMDFYVWEQVCQDLKRWKEEGKPVVPVSVNISRADFNTSNLAGEIEELADRYGVEHELLHLEVTETAYTDNTKQIIAVVNQLRAAGFKIEMDDFGSGSSSLNMLEELAIDVLKLDMHFVQQKSSRGKKGVLGFVFSLSKWLDLDTVAEGAETKEQVDALRDMGCDYVQGYYYAKPMPVQQFEEYIEANYKS